jgi:hypothetical protein
MHWVFLFLKALLREPACNAFCSSLVVSGGSDHGHGGHACPRLLLYTDKASRINKMTSNRRSIYVVISAYTLSIRPYNPDKGPYGRCYRLPGCCSQAPTVGRVWPGTVVISKVSIRSKITANTKLKTCSRDLQLHTLIKTLSNGFLSLGRDNLGGKVVSGKRDRLSFAPCPLQQNLPLLQLERQGPWRSRRQNHPIFRFGYCCYWPCVSPC